MQVQTCKLLLHVPASVPDFLSAVFQDLLKKPSLDLENHQAAKSLQHCLRYVVERL